MATPTDRKYTKEHEWIILEGNTAAIGITDHAQDALGDIVFIELPAAGDTFAAGDSFAVVESVKAVSNIYTPVSGTVTEVNSMLEETPEQINTAPYDSFFVRLRIDAAEDAQLMDSAAYDAFVAQGG